MPASLKTPASLPKRTNWWGAFVIGLAGTILVTGIAPLAVQSMGAASIPVFLLSVSAGVILCLCLAELAAMMPDRTGGLPSYAFETYKSLGPGCCEAYGRDLRLELWSRMVSGSAPQHDSRREVYRGALEDSLGPGVHARSVRRSTSTCSSSASSACSSSSFLAISGIRLGAGFATVLGIVSMVPLTLLVFLPFFRPSTIHWSNVAGFHLADPKAGTFAFFISWIFIMTLVGAGHRSGRLLYRRVQGTDPRCQDCPERLRSLRRVHLSWQFRCSWWRCSAVQTLIP